VKPFDEFAQYLRRRIGNFRLNSPEKILFKIEEGYQPGCIGWVVGMHGRVYVGEQQWNARFEQIVGRELITFFEHYDASKDRFWMASVADQFAASISIFGESPTLARIRFFVADPAFVGKGIGKALLAEALQYCAAGNKNIYLTTVKGLDAARHLYEQAGFQLAGEHEDHSWGSAHIEQRWKRTHART
jgi:GNAT superfamily N-acetyltransferase